MKILVACEFSGKVANAFRAKGHSVTSCDLLPRLNDPNHYQGDVREILNQNWDLIIAHPPCTYLTKARGKKDIVKMMEALEFFKLFLESKCLKVVIENPMPFREVYNYIPKPNHWYCPTHFGHNKKKFTCLWLKGVPPLMPTVYYPKNKAKSLVHSTKGSKYRSVTPDLVAEAMANQWG